MRRAARAIFYDVREERTTLTRRCQAFELIHESTQVEIYGEKGFLATTSCLLPSRIPYRYSDLGSSRVSATGEPSCHVLGDPGHQWYYSSPSSQNFL
jgi:hypothetical protein